MKPYTLKILFLTGFLFACLLASAQDKKISQLPALPSVSGNEQIPLAKSGLNYYTTPTQIKTWLNGPLIDTTKLLHTYGTNTLYPLIGTIEYRGANNTTALVDTIHSLILGAGNLQDLYNATIYANTIYSNNGKITHAASNGTYYVNFIISGYATAIDCNYPNFSGLRYSPAAAGYVLSNYGQYTLAHKGLNDLLYAPISYTATPSTTLTGDIIGTGTGTVSTTNTNSITINGTTQALHGNPSFTVSSGITYTNTAPITITSGSVIGIAQSNSVTAGYLTSADWNTFNNKQNTLIAGTNISITSNTISATVPTAYISTITTTGTSGAATVTSGTLNIPQYAGTTYTVTSPLTLTSNTIGITNIPNASLANSTISGISLGSNLANLTGGYGITSYTYTGASGKSEIVDTTVIASKLYVSAKTTGFLTAASTNTLSNKTLDTTNTYSFNFFPPYFSGQQLYTWGTTTSATAGWNGYIYYVPVFINKSITVTSLNIYTTSSTAGDSIRIGLYTDDGTGKPSKLIEQSGVIVAAAAGVKTYTFSSPYLLSYVKKVYWMAIQSKTSTQAYNYRTGTTPALNFTIGNNGYYGSHAWGSLPSTATTTGQDGSSAMLYLITQ